MDTAEDILKMLLQPPTRKSPTEVLYQAFQADDPRYQRILEDGSTEPDGFKLSFLRKCFNGDEGDIPGPLNTLYPVSLKPWATADPENLYLQIKVPDESSHPFFQRPLVSVDDAKTLEVHIEVTQVGERQMLIFVPSGYLITQGASLAYWRKQFGGDEGEVRGPGMRKQLVSLRPWVNADPELTFVRFVWHEALS